MTERHARGIASGECPYCGEPIDPKAPGVTYAVGIRNGVARSSTRAARPARWGTRWHSSPELT